VANRRVTLRMIKDVIRLKWEGKLSHEQIAAALAVSKGAVTKYVGLAAAASLDWETVREWDERQLLACLLPRSPSVTPYVEPVWGHIHQELNRKGVTLLLLWEESPAVSRPVRAVLSTCAKPPCPNPNSPRSTQHWLWTPTPEEQKSSSFKPHDANVVPLGEFRRRKLSMEHDEFRPTLKMG